jgi:hypothetical protein
MLLQMWAAAAALQEAIGPLAQRRITCFAGQVVGVEVTQPLLVGGNSWSPTETPQEALEHRILVLQSATNEQKTAGIMSF